MRDAVSCLSFDDVWDQLDVNTRVASMEVEAGQ